MEKDDKSLDEQIDDLVTTPHENEHVHLTGSTEMTIDGRSYRLVDNYREAFDPQKLDERYTDILAKYDYIVGDWGFDQLRLHGFYSDNNHFAKPDQVILTLEDYLYEYCNFGCAYFVLEKVQHKTHHSNHHKNNKNTKNNHTKKNEKHPTHNNNNHPFHERKVKPANIKRNNHEKAVKVKKHGQRQFAIRKLHDDKQPKHD